jgi:hypothetical protein
LFDWLELIFSLFKNLLGVPSPKPADCATHPEFQHLHDKFLLVLYQNYFFDAIVTTSLLIVEEQDSSNVVILILLECLYHIFNREKPLDIMKSNESSEKLKNAVHFEKAKKLESSARTSLRHSRFGGTITVKSISNVSLYNSTRTISYFFFFERMEQNQFRQTSSNMEIPLVMLLKLVEVLILHDIFSKMKFVLD